MTPHEIVTSRVALPFPLYPFQIDAVNDLAPLPRSGWWLDMGTGKTISSTVANLYKLIRGDIQHVLVLMPPILLKNWKRTLDSIPGTTSLIYRGTPKEREQMRPQDFQFILMSYQIFCKDWDRLHRVFFNKRTCLTCDEATAVKNVGTQTYKRVRDWALDSDLMLLSGSPISNPGDGYAPIKLVSPTIYRTLSQFEQIHVKSRDFFNNVSAWQNLDLLNQNLLVNSVRVLKTDVLKDLPAVTYTPMYYELDKQHMRTYERLCDEQVLKLADGKKLDATNASALFQALQQIPMNREHFMQEEGTVSAGVELIEETLEELNGGKLVIFTAYRMTNRLLMQRLAKHNAVAVYGEVSRAQQDAAVDRFVDDPECKVILLQIRSGGYGIDRLQSVCNDVFFAEMPLVPAHFSQAVARVWRAGQQNPVTVRIAVAERTIQVRLFDMLQEKDSLVNICIRGYHDLRDALAGTSHMSA